ncbi:hypothetical protein BJX99DRAFT_270799 [Aspergillus californicus]
MDSTPPKIILVTGGAGGLGKAIATAFLCEGHNVAVCDVDEIRLSQTASDWSAHGERALVSRTDITDEKAVEDLTKQIQDKFGRLDMLINNAGVMDTFDPVGTTTEANWNRIIGINLTGTFLTTKAAVALMESQSRPGGIIVNIGSVASYKGLSAGAAYTVSKHGILGLSRNTAAFYGEKGIYSIALLLGGMDDTNIADHIKKGAFNKDGMTRIGMANPGYIPGQTNIPLADVARYCIFFSDPNMAAASNGAAINVNKNWPAS